MKTLPLTWLRAFAALYETGGVRPAARLLDVSHSAVSRQIQDLEQWLGSELVTRREGRRRLDFTAAGERLGREALRSFIGLEQAVTTVREARQGNSVTIAAVPSFAVRWLLPRLGAFEAQHNWVELSVIVDQRRNAPIDYSADLILRMGPGAWPRERTTALMDDALFPVMSEKYWIAQGKPTDPARLASLRLLHDRDPGSAWSRWKQGIGPDHLDIRKGPRFTSSDLVLRAAEQGLGVALARGCLAEESLRAGTLVAPFGPRKIPIPDAYSVIRGDGTASRAALDTVYDWLFAEAAAGSGVPIEQKGK